MASYASGAGLRTKHQYSFYVTPAGTKSASKEGKVQSQSTALPMPIAHSSVVPTTKEAESLESEVDLGCFMDVPTPDWPSVPSLSANTLEELVSRLPNNIDGPILVDTTESYENWEKMIGEEDGIPCSIVWYGGKMFIIELPSIGHDTAIVGFMAACEAKISLLQAQQRLKARLTVDIDLHHPAPAQPTTVEPDAQWELNGVPVLVLEVGWSQSWNQLLRKAHDYLTLTNGAVKLVVLVKIFQETGIPAYTPGVPQPAAVGPVTLHMRAAVASILNGQVFLSQGIQFGLQQANHANPRLPLPFRRLYPQADRAAVDNALGPNPYFDLTQLRDETEEAYLRMVKTGKSNGR